MEKTGVAIILLLILIGFVSAEASNNVLATGNNNSSRTGNDSSVQDNIKNQTQTKEQNSNFCGSSTYGACESDFGCTKGGCSGSVCQSINEEPVVTTCEYQECYNSQRYKRECLCISNKCQWTSYNKTMPVKNMSGIRKEKNRLRIRAQESECPQNCTCSGSVTKCSVKGGREMTIVAGKSGNIIVQVKGANMSTNVTLYKSDNQIFGVFRNNQTKQVKVLPDQVKEELRKKIKAKLQDENITLDEDGFYKIRIKKRARFFLIIPVKVRVRAEVNSETGEITRLKNSWWSFLAKDIEEPILGEDCRTVSPDSTEECCKRKGYDVWNAEANECKFSD